MRKLTTIIILIIITIAASSQDLLAKKRKKSNNPPVSAKKASAPKKSTSKKNISLVKILKQIDSSSVDFKDRKILLYPNPPVLGHLIWALVYASLIALCGSSRDGEGVALLLFIVEVVCVIQLLYKLSYKFGRTPYIVIDKYGILIKNKLIVWSQISNILKEIVNRKSGGFFKSQYHVFHFYNDSLQVLFELSELDDYIPIKFDDLISIIYYYLEKSNTEYYESLQVKTA